MFDKIKRAFALYMVRFNFCGVGIQFYCELRGSEGAPGSGCGVGPDRRSVLQGESTCLQCCVPWVLLTTI